MFDAIGCSFMQQLFYFSYFLKVFVVLMREEEDEEQNFMLVHMCKFLKNEFRKCFPQEKK